MKQGRYWMQRMMDRADLPSETLPGLPVVEIAGERRVLIENHLGVTEYGRERICVKVKFGHIRVCGGCLELAKMTKGQLVVSGRIDSVSLIRRNG